MQGETIPVHRAPSDGPTQSTLELRVRYSDRPREVIPLLRTATEHDVDGVLLRFTAEEGRTRFRCITPAARVYKDGEAVVSGTLEVGASIEVGPHRVFLWDAGDPVAYLKGYSSPYANEIWPLHDGRHPIGRAGKRRNAIQLDHGTVSREHATILVEGDGRYVLLGESATNPVFLRGEAVAPQETRPLQHGDLIELGSLVFRFHHPAGATADAERDGGALRIRSLGGFTVHLGARTVPDKAWRTQYVKWMFAHLAYCWDRPLGIEVLLDELWPDADPKNARNNFNFSLSTLRRALREEMPDASQPIEIVLRTSSTLQLNPDVLDRHDALALQRVAAARPQTSDAVETAWERAAETAVLSCQGPFLPECYLDWADAARQTLEIALSEVGRTLLERFAERAAWDRAITLGNHVLGIDRCAQWACVHVMRALSHTGRAPEALRLFETSRAHWMESLGAAPEMDVLREHQRILTLL